MRINFYVTHFSLYHHPLAFLLHQGEFLASHCVHLLLHVLVFYDNKVNFSVLHLIKKHLSDVALKLLTYWTLYFGVDFNLTCERVGNYPWFLLWPKLIDLLALCLMQGFLKAFGEQCHFSSIFIIKEYVNIIHCKGKKIWKPLEVNIFIVKFHKENSYYGIKPVRMRKV